MSEHGSQAINRALGILRCFTAERPTAALKDICAVTGLTTPTAHRMVKALQSNGFLVRLPDHGGYALGPAVMELAHVVLTRSDHSDLVAASLPHLERLRGLTGETVGLQVRIGTERMCLAELQSHQPMRMARGVGHISPLHAGAAGKALMAWLTPEQRAAVLAGAPLRRLTPRTVADADALEAELETVRRRGFALSIGEVVTEASAIAVPVLGHSGAVRAAVNVTGPVSRWNERRMTAAAEEIRNTVAAIELTAGRTATPRWKAG